MPQSDRATLVIRLSRGGLILCAVYVACSVALFAAGFLAVYADPTAQGGEKSQYILGQLAVAPAMLVLTFTGLLDPMIAKFPWMNAYKSMFIMSSILVYLVGWAMTVGSYIELGQIDLAPLRRPWIDPD